MIKNIIFDVGDVLLSYRWEDMLTKDHGISRERAHLIAGHMFSSPYWGIMDLGTETEEEVLYHWGQSFPDEIDDMRWFIEHCDLMPVPRPAVWEAVHRLKEKGYRLYILSNYSHYLFSHHTDGRPFMEDMDGMVVSYMIHRTKPDSYIYQYLLDKYDLKPEESFFYDDRPENTAAAEALGIKTFTVPKTDQQALIDHINSTFLA